MAPAVNVNILGIYSSFSVNHHDPGAAIICDGRIVAVCEEERFSRVKSARGVLPIRSIRACLKQAGIAMNDIDLVVSPGETIEFQADRTVSYLSHFFGHVPEIHLVNHQTAHIASAFFASGFERAMCLSYDNSGDRLSAEIAVGDGNQLLVTDSIDNSNSLGRFYALMTQFLGFEAGEDEYKVMGLAPYGKPGVDLSDIIRPTTSGFEFDNRYFRTHPPVISVCEPFYGDRLVKLLGAPRHSSEPLTQRHMDIAFATQQMMEACAISLITRMHRDSGIDSLCMAGGVALNCSANGKIVSLPFLKRVFVQPAASDRGLALGCALLGTVQAGDTVETPRHVFCCGPIYSPDEIRRTLKLLGAEFRELSDPSAVAAEMLAQGKIVGWFQGRSEYGPRALGHRSILADPRSAEMKDKINTRIKFREEFRPFAPAVTEDNASEYFDMRSPSPFMTVAFPVYDRHRADIAAVTHVNGTARVQTVNRETDEAFYTLIRRFGQHTGIPVVLNTSFNVKGQPIVETPQDAVSTFASSGMDALVLDRFLLTKRAAPSTS